jgi:anti-sigma factor RsiW
MRTVHAAVGASALGVLPSREAPDFDAHLAGCDECAAELREFSAIAETLARVDPRLVPDHERRRRGLPSWRIVAWLLVAVLVIAVTVAVGAQAARSMAAARLTPQPTQAR